MKLVVFSLKKSHNSSLLINSFFKKCIWYCLLLKRLLKIDLIREEFQARKKIAFQQMLLLPTFIINAMLSILFTVLHKAKYILNIFPCWASLPLIFPFQCSRGCTHFLGAHPHCNIPSYWAMTHDFTGPFKLQWSLCFLYQLPALNIPFEFVLLQWFFFHIILHVKLDSNFHLFF